MASKTKELIINTFLSIVEENEFDKVSVTDIVERCSISRQTFYYHFEGIDSMLEWAFFNETSKAIIDAKDCNDWMGAIRTLQPFLEKFHPLFVSVRNSSSLMLVQKLLARAIFKFTVDYYQKYQNFKGDGSSRQRFLVKYSCSAIVGLIFMEMEFDEDFSYEKLFEEIEEIFKK